MFVFLWPYYDWSWRKSCLLWPPWHCMRYHNCSQHDMNCFLHAKFFGSKLMSSEGWCLFGALMESVGGTQRSELRQKWDSLQCKGFHFGAACRPTRISRDKRREMRKVDELCLSVKYKDNGPQKLGGGMFTKGTRSHWTLLSLSLSLKCWCTGRGDELQILVFQCLHQFGTDDLSLLINYCLIASLSLSLSCSATLTINLSACTFPLDMMQNFLIFESLDTRGRTTFWC